MIAKYQSLLAGTSLLSDAVKRVTWTLCRQEDVSKLRKSLAILTAAVGLLLHTILLSRSASQDLRVSSSLVQQSALLQELQAQLQDGSFEQMELSKRMESLLLSGSKLTSKSDFLVRPL